MDDLLLERTVKHTLRMFYIDPDIVKRRSNWESEKEAFVDRVVTPMSMLKYFGFTDEEIHEFQLAADEKLPLALALIILKQELDHSKNMTELEQNFAKEWFADDLLDKLDKMADKVLDAFFIAKGGVCFKTESE